MDFYENLAAMENEAMRRAAKIGNAERLAAQRFNESAGYSPPNPAPHEPPCHPPHHNSGIGKLFGGGLLRGDLLRSPDLSLIAIVFLILNAEQSDPLLLLALVYILM